MTQLIVLLTGVTAILAIAWLSARFLFTRCTSRDLIWRTALLLVAVAPLAVVARGAIREWQFSLAVLPAEASISAKKLDQLPPPPLAARSRTPRLDSLVQQRALPVVPKGYSGPYPMSIPQESAIAEQPELVASGVPANPETPDTRAFSWPGALLLVWATGFLWQAGKLVRSSRRAGRLAALSVIGSDSELDDLNAWAAMQVGISRPVPLLQNAEVAGPIACGTWRPRIILPNSLMTLAARQQLRAALLHEYGHIHRHDLAYEVLLQLVTAIYWPHPLVYLMARALRHLREEICDNFVLTRESPVSYSETLLRLSMGNCEGRPELIGLGMLSPKFRLEDRIAAILSPSRSLDTRPTHWMRRGVTVLAVLLMLIAFGVRFERASAEPAELARPTDAGRRSAAGESDPPVAASASASGTGRASTAENGATPRVFRFQVLSHDQKPVEGAVVVAWGVQCNEGGGWGVSENAWLKAKTDSDGFVNVAFTKEGDAGLTWMLGRSGTREVKALGLRIDHPDFPVRSDYFPVEEGKAILLAEPITITVRARREGEITLANGLYPQVSRSLSNDFSEEDGVLTIRRVDLDPGRGENWLRIVQVSDGEPAWFSDPIVLRRGMVNSIDLDLVLKRGASLEGRLGEMVPKGIRKGRVIAGVTSGAGRPFWNAVTDIAADGTFRLESFPAGSDVQLIALCDGWVSRSPSEEEVTRYSELHGFPSRPEGGSRAGMVLPQLVRLTGAMNHVVIPMLRTASCELKVVDDQGKPLPDVVIQFSPNQMLYDFGSTTLGTGHDNATLIRAQIAAGGRHDPTPIAKPEEAYGATTNADGLAVVTGLPAPEADSGNSHSETFSVGREGYTVISNFDPGFSDPGELPIPMLVVSLTAGRTERMTVRMLPDSGEWSNPIGANEPDASGAAQPQAVLEGRVIDEEGRLLVGVEVLPVNEDFFQIRTDRNGRFRQVISNEPLSEEQLSEVPIRFVKPGFAPTWAGLFPGKRDQVVTLRKNTYFEGTVTRPNGQPAANVKVGAWQSREHIAGAMPSPYVYESWTETRTDERGYYRLLVQPAPYVLVFGDSSAEMAWIPRAQDESTRADGDTPMQRPRIGIDPNVGKRLDVQLEPGVDVRMRFVNGLTGKPVPDVVVTPRDYSGLEQKTDSTGRAAVPCLPATDVTFSFHAEGFLRGSSETALISKRTNQNGPPKFVLRRGASFSLEREMPEMVVTLEPAVEVSGWVLDPEGNGVPMALVSLVSPSGDATDIDAANLGFRTLTSKDGRFSLWIPPLDDRPCHLLAHDQGWMKFSPASESNTESGRRWANAIGPKLQAKAGEKLENIELRLGRPGQIQGRVVDEEGRPLADVAIFSGSADGSEGTVDLPREVSDREGRFVLTGVRPGQQQLHSSLPPQRRTSKRQAHQVVEVIAGKTTDAGDIVIPSSPALR